MADVRTLKDADLPRSARRAALRTPRAQIGASSSGETSTMRDPISGGRAIVVGTLIATLFWMGVAVIVW